MLARKLEGWLDWFDRGAAAYSAWRGKEPIREPNPGSKDSDERKLAAWRKDVATQAASGSLPRELFDKAAAAGVPFAESIDPASLPGMDALRLNTAPASAAPARRCALGLALAAGISVLAMGQGAYSPRMAFALSLEGGAAVPRGRVGSMRRARQGAATFERHTPATPGILRRARRIGAERGADAAVGLALCPRRDVGLGVGRRASRGIPARAAETAACPGARGGMRNARRRRVHAGVLRALPRVGGSLAHKAKGNAFDSGAAGAVAAGRARLRAVGAQRRHRLARPGDRAR